MAPIGECRRPFAFSTRRDTAVYFASVRKCDSGPQHDQVEPGPEQPARLCHRHGGRVPCVHRLPELATRCGASLRRSPLWLEGEPDCRWRALARLRLVLWVPVPLPDAADVLSVRPIRVAESLAQGRQEISVRPCPAPRRAVRNRAISADAADLLSGLSRHRG